MSFSQLLETYHPVGTDKEPLIVYKRQVPSGSRFYITGAGGGRIEILDGESGPIVNTIEVPANAARVEYRSIPPTDEIGHVTARIYGDMESIQIGNSEGSTPVRFIQWGDYIVRHVSLRGGSRFEVFEPDYLSEHVTSTESMFYGCSAYSMDNNDFTGWDFSRVTSAQSMFYSNTTFNMDISGWDTSSLTNSESMFQYCTNFNPARLDWNTSSLTNSRYMFNGCTQFNADISGWDVSRVQNMAGMFQNCPAFNSDLIAWRTSSATSMSYMFRGCTVFNRDVSGFDTSGVIGVNNMQFMFNGCAAFNQNLSSWCVSGIPSKPLDFDTGATSWVLPKPVWGTCP